MGLESCKERKLTNHPATGHSIRKSFFFSWDSIAVGKARVARARVEFE